MNTDQQELRETPNSSSELVGDDVADEVGCGGKAELIEHAMLVGADGLGAEVKFDGDLAGAPAGGNGEQDLEFLGGEIGVVGNGPGVVNSPANRFTEKPLTIEDGADGLQESGTAGTLGDKTGGAELEGTDGVERIGLHAEHEDGGLGTVSADFAQDEEAVVAGKTDIENDEAPGPGLDLSEGFLGSLGLAESEVAELVAQHLLEALAKEQVIIDNQYRYFLWRWHESKADRILSGSTILGVSGFKVNNKKWVRVLGDERESTLFNGTATVYTAPGGTGYSWSRQKDVGIF